MSTPGRPQRGIQSIEVGGRLLTTLAEVGEPMTLKDLAQQSDMPAAKPCAWTATSTVAGGGRKRLRKRFMPFP